MARVAVRGKGADLHAAHSANTEEVSTSAFARRWPTVPEPELSALGRPTRVRTVTFVRL